MKIIRARWESRRRSEGHPRQAWTVAAPQYTLVAFETHQLHEELLKSQTKEELTCITEQELNLRLF
jgi:hypothetical protein